MPVGVPVSRDAAVINIAIHFCNDIIVIMNQRAGSINIGIDHQSIYIIICNIANYFERCRRSRNKKGGIDYTKDFFGKETSLTVSGQLEGELGAMALGDIYTFGPTFRAENSNTPRHLAEFWMIEPEMAFYAWRQVR